MVKGAMLFQRVSGVKIVQNGFSRCQYLANGLDERTAYVVVCIWWIRLLNPHTELGGG